MDQTRREFIGTSISVLLLPIIKRVEKEYDVLKIVSTSNNRYYSFCINNNLSLEYKINEWIYPKMGKIFVFNNIPDIKQFLMYNNTSVGLSAAIFYAKAIGLTEPHFNKISQIDSDKHDIPQKFWSVGYANFKGRLRTIPKGTMFCDALKLVERIKI